jgi:hypothetical protein
MNEEKEQKKTFSHPRANHSPYLGASFGTRSLGLPDEDRASSLEKEILFLTPSPLLIYVFTIEEIV